MQRKLIKIGFSIVGLWCCAVIAQAAEPIELKSGLIYPAARSIPPFRLDWQTNANSPREYFTNDNLKGHWTLMFFGFTNCSGLCPTSMKQFVDAYAQLQAKHVTPLPQVVFVSVDPGRDTAAKTAIFATTFNKNFIGITSNNTQELSQLAKSMNAMFQIIPVPHSTTGEYTVDHSGDVAVLNPQGEYVAVLTMPHKTADIVADYQTILDHAKQKPSLWIRIKSIFG
jgi:cytochrome oxidase Cu insertion factor (SCO1/SenC/PrrC family)